MHGPSGVADTPYKTEPLQPANSDTTNSDISDDMACSNPRTREIFKELEQIAADKAAAVLSLQLGSEQLAKSYLTLIPKDQHYDVYAAVAAAAGEPGS